MTATTQLHRSESGSHASGPLPALERSAQLVILEQLQTTLDLEQLLLLLQEQVNHHLAIEGLEFHSESLQEPAVTGLKATHSCGYRLVNGSAHLGELVFRRNRKFRERELVLLESMIPLFFGPLNNALSFRAAMDRSFRDPASGARNQLALREILPREIALAQRHNRPLSGILIDACRLGDINRRFGHAAGDHTLEVIVHVSESLSRETDMLFRVEDDTLLLLLQETGEAGARQLSERLTQACAETDTEHDGQKLHPSIAVACVTVSGTDTATSLINRGLQQLRSSQKAT